MTATLEREAELFRTLAHPGRLAILHSLRQGPACVCHLTAMLRRPQAYISQQLSLLKEAGLVESWKDGQFVYYRLRDLGALGLIDLGARLVDDPRPSWPPPGVASAACDCPQCTSSARPAAVVER
ncbi:MAG: metalloregulator ArsR/SmtB family transcription factor [Armatimonadota bacterium]|nr:metalloregulator ArsR/SmtB family transcription factor [Armatimonadota bacterium]